MSLAMMWPTVIDGQMPKAGEGKHLVAAAF